MRLTRALCASNVAAARSAQARQLDSRSHPSSDFSARLRSKKPPSQRDSKRCDILSQDLCDHALTLLQDGLPEKGTCDIIDLNPGLSVWSKSLHNVLQPRRHVLVEPEWNTYAKALQPLLNADQSHFRYAPTIEDAFDLSKSLLSPELVHQFQNISSSQRREPNHQLIIVANLARRPTPQAFYLGNFGAMFMHYFYRSMTDNAGELHLHQHGLVKLFAWVSDSEKLSINPRSIMMRFKLARHLEASCNIREVVSGIPEFSRLRRPWPGAQVESMRQLDVRHPQWTTRIPPSRRQSPSMLLSETIDPVSENFDLLAAVPDRSKVLNAFLDQLSKFKKAHPKEEKQLEAYFATNSIKTRPGLNAVPGFREVALNFTRLRNLHHNHIQVDALSRQQYNYERDLRALREASPHRKRPYLKRLKELGPELEAIPQKALALFKDSRYAFNKAIDEYRCILHGVMPWNTRTFEPLLCRPEDVYPHQGMTLLEITPKPSFVARVNTLEKQACFDYVNQCVTGTGTQVRTVDLMIEFLVGSKDTSTYKEFLAQIPSLTDPLKGGYHDLSQIRSRTLGSEQLIDIALTYEAWPYRKATDVLFAELRTK